MAVFQMLTPEDSLLARQAQRGDYLDTFAVNVRARVGLQDFAGAFYNTRLFKLERLLLRWAGWPSRDEDARALADGSVDRFAFWSLEAHRADELLMRDLRGVTCSWLCVQSLPHGTRLWFGSGVRARRSRDGGSNQLPLSYRALMGLHVLYSRALLAAAARAWR